MSDLPTEAPAAAAEPPGPAPPGVDFRTEPSRYRHWRLSVDGPVATLTMDVDEHGGIVPGYELKLNSYDLGVDIELYDAVQRLRFEHPRVRAVVVTGGKEKVFCAGANIRMLAASDHGWKVNFCKFTNETRGAIEDASAHSGQTWIAAVNGTASGGGYELALACEHLMLIDDRSSVVSLPELPLLGVLPGTGGLTRVLDKRHVRRDRADYFATRTEGIGGRRAVQWRLVDEVVPRPAWEETVARRAGELAARSDRPRDATGITLTPLTKTRGAHTIAYRYVTADLDPQRRTAEISLQGPDGDAPSDMAAAHALGADFWPLAVARELDDLVLDLRTNETELGTWLLRTRGEAARVLAHDALLLDHADDWLAREITLYLKRTLKRLDVTSRSVIALAEPGSCFAGTLLELLLAADRSFALDGVFEEEPEAGCATVTVGPMNLGPLPMGNGLTRLATRFLGDDVALTAVEAVENMPQTAAAAEELGLVTFAPDDIDWADEVRLTVEERAGFSPDALTGLEANYRFPGPETLETKIFGRLSAWQNWIFYRPNASGPDGALRAYGTGRRAAFDRKRV
ncbi:2,3-epoxybenzoyl-CoA dihydrolase [Streptomyces sp. VRA16 Mangrove soil]|uniref:2,3-epoxybenzoyl-CoA dihydrolase n=1 Tax=Streptomyces sp. VRA16 Mangrove soil TaxID=2817434 RepID=UPI001A9F8B88|nr:2,3-epoxybenzoyl-CoA dihydrolase [Streptomyces sp. VRA16 Mangrove soil]MBO1330139.1 benzoyl-CoA-dihydrodiol lyase [Streptomyces sp. VRA16 Mangrove soil]